METKGKVVVGVDGSESSVQALRLAARLAPALDAQIQAVACWEFPKMRAGYRYVMPDLDALQAAEAKALQDALEAAFGIDVPDGLSPDVIRGPAPATLVEAAAGAALLVVGRRGHGGFLGMHLGSVSSACVSHAACPVLVVHSDGQLHDGQLQTERNH